MDKMIKIDKLLDSFFEKHKKCPITIYIKGIATDTMITKLILPCEHYSQREERYINNRFQQVYTIWWGTEQTDFNRINILYSEVYRYGKDENFGAYIVRITLYSGIEIILEYVENCI